MKELEDIRAEKLESYWNDMKPPSVTLETKIPNSPIEMTDENFNSVVQEYDFLIVDCWAPWCGPCKMLSPIIDELARDYEGKIVFGKLNTDMNRRMSATYGILSIPTLLFFKNGKHMDTMIGAVPKNVLEEMIRTHL